MANAGSMSWMRAILVFSTGYLIGAVITTLIGWSTDGTWSSGPFMVGLSLPVTIGYFLGLWGLGIWGLYNRTSAGMALAGMLCAIYPTFCGFFPVYFLRVEFAGPTILGQFGLLVISCVVFSRLEQRG